MRVLRRRQFGDPILRQKTNRLSKADIASQPVQQLIDEMHHTLESRQYGVGLAAPQVGQNLAISVIAIKPTPTRPNLKREELVVINPKLIQSFGKPQPMWEGCISGPELYAQVPRYKKVKVSWQDKYGKSHEKTFEGFMAHVLQHEIDHLEGILFVDKVEDTHSYMTFSEYKKMKKRST